MTGAEHYLEAEKIMEHVDKILAGSTPTSAQAVRIASERLLAKAQVHATLALAAATNLPGEEYEV